jgi:hypothetical protein
MKTFEQMVVEVSGWLSESREAIRADFIDCDEHKLSVYHHTLGRNIRNRFNLWEREWEPKLIEGIDHSDDHPDAISMRIIVEVWRRAQNL